LRKIEILLKALEKAEKGVEYYALDLSLAELQRTLSAVPKGKFKHVQCFGLHGTYDDGLEWLKSKQMANRPKSILSMGSSIGNFEKPDAAGFLKNFAEVLQPGDTLLIGIDACTNPEKVYHAYNDVAGITHEFILNGLEHANRLLATENCTDIFDISQWKVIGEYDDVQDRHVAYVSPKQDLTVYGVVIKKDERIQIEESNKYSSDETNQLFRGAGLVQGPRWTNHQGDYGEFMTRATDLRLIRLSIDFYYTFISHSSVSLFFARCGLLFLQFQTSC
jgi:EasF-like predicted methyltransferase